MTAVISNEAVEPTEYKGKQPLRGYMGSPQNGRAISPEALDKLIAEGAAKKAGPVPTEEDRTLIANGYEPIAAVGKVPVATAWQARPNTVEAITAERATFPNATNTGLRTGRLVGVDIDIVDDGRATRVQELVREFLGHTEFERVGSKGAMLCYRNETPVRKIVVAGTTPDGKKEKVEILGAGQQFVAFGIHPDTGKDYRWVGLMDPLTATLAELPEVTPDQLSECAQTAAALLREMGYSDVKVSDPSQYKEARTAARAERVPVPEATLVEILGYIDPDCGIVTWISRLGSLCATSLKDVPEAEMDDRLLQIATAWSAGEYWKDGQPESYLGPDDVEKHWDTLTPDKLGGSTFGSLYATAKEHGYTGRLPQHEIVYPKPEQAADDIEAGERERVEQQAEALRRKFRRVKLSEFATRPDPTFWDPDTKMIPKVVGAGATVLVYGQWGSHKTNVMLTWIMDMLGNGARVLYAAGEGATGVGKRRLPAHCRERGKTIDDIEDNLAIVEAVPHLGNETEVAVFIEMYSEFAPNVVIIDTLATATAGEDENTSKFSGHLTDNGAVGTIKRAFKATVLVIAHEGKDSSKGARGHSGLHGNIDAGLRVVAEENSPRFSVFVDKMRDGNAKFSTYYAVDPASLTDKAVIPVPKRISEDEFKTMGPKPTGYDELLSALRTVLEKEGAYPGSGRAWNPVTQTGGLKTAMVARSILMAQGEGDEPTKDEIAAMKRTLQRRADTDTRFAAYKVGKDGQADVWAIPECEED